MILSNGISILKPVPPDNINQARDCLASQTYATRSCLLTVVAMRLQVPIERSVQGIKVTATTYRQPISQASIYLDFSPSSSWMIWCRSPSYLREEVSGDLETLRSLTFPSSILAFARLQEIPTSRPISGRKYDNKSYPTDSGTKFAFGALAYLVNH